MVNDTDIEDNVMAFWRSSFTRSPFAKSYKHQLQLTANSRLVVIRFLLSSDQIANLRFAAYFEYLFSQPDVIVC